MPFSAEYLICRCVHTDLRTDKLIKVGLGNIQFLQVKLGRVRDARGIVPAHRQNGQQSGHTLHRRFICCRPGGRRGDTEQVTARWKRLVAFMKALDLLHQVMHALLHRRTTTAIEMASDGGEFIHCCRLFRLIKM